MPRTLKREKTTPRKNDSKNKKRKRTEDDNGNTGNKKMKVAWLRDIKAVLRSAGNRLGYTENALTFETKRKQNNQSRESEKIINSSSEGSNSVGMLTSSENINLDWDRIDVINDNDFCNSDRNVNNALSQAMNEEISIEPNTDDEEDSIQFRQIQCKASGTHIRIENYPSDDNPPQTDVDNTNHQNQVFPTLAHANNNYGTYVNITDENVSNPKIKKDNKLLISGTNLDSIISTRVYSVDTQRSNLRNYFFGNEKDVADTSNTVFTFESPYCQQNSSRSRTETNRMQSENDLNQIEIIGNPIIDSNNFMDPPNIWINQCKENSVQVSSTLDTLNDQNERTTSEYNHITPTLCDTECGYYSSAAAELNDFQIVGSESHYENGYNHYQTPDHLYLPTEDSSDLNINGQTYKVCENANTQVIPAYYDSSRGAFFDPNNLPEEKLEIPTNSFKSTWGSIKNLISRVSGQKGNGESNRTQPDSAPDKTEGDPNS